MSSLRCETTTGTHTGGWTNEQYCDRSALRRCRTGDTLSAGKDLARAHATTPDRGVADEERLQACRGPPFQSSRRLGAVDCRVMAVEPNKTLSYTWAAYGLESVVTWTLTPTSTGTHLRMEQSGFRPDHQQAY